MNGRQIRIACFNGATNRALLGMVALIQAGDNPPNLDSAQKVKHPGRAAQRMSVLFEMARSEGAAQTGQAPAAQ